MKDQEKERRLSQIEYIESHYNEETGKFDFTCKCGIKRALNYKQVFACNMHPLKCKECGDIIIKQCYGKLRVKSTQYTY